MTCIRVLPFTVRQLSVKRHQVLFPFIAFILSIIHAKNRFVKGGRGNFVMEAEFHCSVPADRRFGEEQSKADKKGRERKGEQRGGNVGIGRNVGFCTSFIFLPSPKFPPR